MIRQVFPKLFTNNNVSLYHNGLGLLKDAIKCETNETQNAEFELELTYPVDGFLANDLMVDMIIRAKANQTQDEQLFRIYSVEKSIQDNSIVVKARHITNDLSNCFVERLELKNANQTTALNNLSQAGDYDHGFQFFTDKSTVSSTLLERQSLLACFAGVEGSILDNWGGEIVRDNYTLSMIKRRGQDNALKVLYRKNLTGLDMTIDGSSVVTAIYPFAKDKEDENKVITLSGDKFIRSNNYGTFEGGQVTAVDYSNDESVVNSATLLAKANNYFAEHSSESLLNIDVKFEQFRHSSEYEKFQNLERVNIGDEVTCYYPPLNINAKGRVVKYTYDCLNQEYVSLEIGDVKSDFLNNIKNDTNDAINKVKDDTNNKLNDFNNQFQDMIEDQTNKITGDDGGYVRLRPKDNPSEILIMDNEDANLANKILRMNKSGIGFSQTGINGPYGTAWTIDGKFSGNYIMANTITGDKLTADAIQVGFQRMGNTIRISPTELSFWNGGNRSLSLQNDGMHIIDSSNNEQIGNIRSNSFAGHPDLNGLEFELDPQGDFVAWSTRREGEEHYTVQLAWVRASASDSLNFSPGLNIMDQVSFGKGIYVPGSYQLLNFADITFNNTHYPYFGSAGLKAGLLYGSTQIYLISDGGAYNLTKVIKAFGGLSGRYSIPNAVNSDGTLKSWTNITF